MPRLAILFVILAGCSSSATPAPVDEVPKPGAADRLAPPRPGSDWPTFGGPTGDLVSPETGILTTWPKDGLKKLWDCPLGIGYAPPSVVGGKLFHLDRHADTVRVSCRNAVTGELIWKYEYPTDYEDLYGYDSGPRACPVVDGDRLYIHGVEGMLVCLNTADGKELWKVDTKSKYHFHQNFFGVGSVPLVDGDVLIVPVGGSPKGPRPTDLREAKGNGTAIVGFDKMTGAVKYSFGDETSSYSNPRIATIDGKRIGLYFARGGLLGFDPQAGKQLFHYSWRAKILESVNAATPLIVGDQVLVTECYGVGSALVKISPEKVTPIWTDAGKDRGEQALMSHWCTPIHHDGYVYGCSGRHSNEADLRCFDLKTGEVKWTERRTTRCTLLKIDGHLMSFSEGGELRLIKLNPAKYDEVARWEVPGMSYPSWAPPVVSRGLLYLRGKDETNRDGHRLACYQLQKQ